jgi:hypothetical protein
MKSNVNFYRSSGLSDRARSMRTQSHVGGVILHRGGGQGSARSSSLQGQRSNMNGKVNLHRG